MRRAKGLVAIVLMAVLGGCQNADRDGGRVDRGAPPSFAQVAARYNQRVEHLDRYWSDATVRFRSVDSEGNAIDEQGDGHVQVIRPRKLFLTVGKVGEVGYELGSNDASYWWIDVRNKEARVGEHARYTPEIGRRAGLPVHPLDVLEVLGMVPLEAASERTPSVAWSDDGRWLLVRTARGGGGRLIVLDPEAYEPHEVHLLDDRGALVVKAVLTEPKNVEMPDESRGRVRHPTKFEITVPSTQTYITLWARNPQNRGSRIKEQAFDLQTLLRQFGVTSVRRIDD